MKVFFFLIFWSLWYLNFSSRTVISPLLPVIQDELSLSHAVAGSLFLFLSIGYTTAVFLSGFLSYRIGQKRLILSGFVILATALVSLRYVALYPSFAVASFFIGIGSGVYLPCAIPLLTSIFSPGVRGKAIAFHQTAGSLSILTIPLLTALALRFFHWRTLFLILGGACFMAMITFWAFAPNPPTVEQKKTRWSAILRHRDLWIMTMLWALASMAAGGIYNIIPLFLVNEKGMQLEVANSIFGLSRVGGFVVTILIGFALDRYEAKKILFLALITTGLSTMGLAMAQRFWLLMMMLMIQATVCVAFFPVALMALSKLADLHERSMFTGVIIGIAVIIGVGITPVVLGAVADVWNFQIGILVLGALMTLSSVALRGLKRI
jgi:MFS family permease